MDGGRCNTTSDIDAITLRTYIHSHVQTYKCTNYTPQIDTTRAQTAERVIRAGKKKKKKPNVTVATADPRRKTATLDMKAAATCRDVGAPKLRCTPTRECVQTCNIYTTACSRPVCALLLPTKKATYGTLRDASYTIHSPK